MWKRKNMRYLPKLRNRCQPNPKAGAVMKVELEVGEGTMNIITVDGVKITLELLRSLANPDPTRTYRLERKEDVVTVSVLNPGSQDWEMGGSVMLPDAYIVRAQTLDRFDRLGEHDYVTVSMERIVHIVRVEVPAPERESRRWPLWLAYIVTVVLLGWFLIRGAK